MKISYALLFLIIVSGVFIGNLSFDLFKQSTAYATIRALLHDYKIIVGPALNIAPPLSPSENLPTGLDKPSHATAIQTCEYWRSKHNTNPDSYNESMMAMACGRAKSLGQ